MSRPFTDASTLLATAINFSIATELAWRSQLAQAVADGGMSLAFAKELTQGAVDDTATLLLDGAIGPNKDVKKGGANWDGMIGNVSDRLLEIGNEAYAKEQLNVQ